MTSIGRSDPDRGLPAAVRETPVAEAAAAATQATSPAADTASGQRTGGLRGRLPLARSWAAAIAGVLVLPVVVAATLTFAASGTGHAPNVADARVVSAADLEAEYGIRVGLVAVTANGGLVDVRFTVVDKDKASHVLHDEASLPELFVEASGRVLSTSQSKAHKMVVLDGATYFLLYPNSGGAIQGGTPVSVVVGNVRLAPVDAQS